jgi:hypothetical protein
VFDDNEIAIRARGPGGRGSAHVTIKDCAIDRAQVGLRIEDMIERLKLHDLGFGADVKTRLEFHNAKDLPGFENLREHDAPPMEELLKSGFPAR